MLVLPKKERELFAVLAREVAGPRAALVLRALEDKLFRDDEAAMSTCWFEEETARIEGIIFARERGPFTLIHEFGHAYHCFYFAAETAALCLGLKDGVHHLSLTEAIAYLFEERLAQLIPQFLYRCPVEFPFLSKLQGAWTKRVAVIEGWAPPALDILHNLGHTDDEPIHDLVKRIIHGAETPDCAPD